MRWPDRAPWLALLLATACSEGPSSAPGPEPDLPDETPDAGGADAPPVTPDAGADAEGDCPRVSVRVPGGLPLNVRPDASTAGAPVGTLNPHDIVDVLEELDGEAIDGVSRWYRIASPKVSGFVFSGLTACTTARPEVFTLPLECDTSARISQGNLSTFSHQGLAAYGFDFALPVGVPMTAMSDGEVLYVYDRTKPGQRCYNGGDASCINEANLVLLRHEDASRTLYAHLSSVSVKVGDKVRRGAPVGLSGSTGYSTGPHAHVQREQMCQGLSCQSIPMEFAEVGVPVQGQTVTAMACPKPAR